MTDEQKKILANELYASIDTEQIRRIQMVVPYFSQQPDHVIRKDIEKLVEGIDDDCENLTNGWVLEQDFDDEMFYLYYQPFLVTVPFAFIED